MRLARTSQQVSSRGGGDGRLVGRVESRVGETYLDGTLSPRGSPLARSEAARRPDPSPQQKPVEKCGLAQVAVIAAFLGLCPAARGAYEVLEAYGDSITAGFLSHTEVTDPPPMKTVSRIVSDLALYLLSHKKEILDPHHAPKKAWPNLVGVQLQKLGQPVRLSDRSVSGSKVHQLVRQLDDKPQESPTVAFFFIGHNDLCDNLDAPETISAHFEKHFRKTLAEWDVRHRRSKAVIVPVADIHRVFDVLKNVVWFKGEQGAYSCRDSWEKLFPYCPSHSRKQKEGKLEEYLVPRLRAINSTLAVLAHELDAASPDNRFVLTDILFDLRGEVFKPEYFAVDCYHLSERGQTRMAQVVMEKVEF